MKKSDDMETDVLNRSTCRRLPIPEKNSATCDDDINEWKAHIRMVDIAMTSLLKELDVVYAAVRIAVDKSKEHSQEKPDENQSYETKSLRSLLLSIETMVVHGKDVARNTVKNFLHILINTITQITETSLELFEPLSLDSSDNQFQNAESLKGIQSIEYEKLAKENADIKLHVSSLKEEIAILLKTENGILEENNNLRDNIKDLELYNENLKDKIIKFEEQESKLTNEHSKALADNKKISEMEKKILHLQKENADLTYSCEMLQVKSDEQKIEKEDLFKRQIEDLKNENDLFSNFDKEKSEKITHLKSDIERLSKENEDKEKINETLKKDNNELKNKISQLSTECKNTESESNSEKKQLRMQNEETVKLLSTRIEEAEHRTKECNQLKQKFQDLSQNHEAIKNELQKKDRAEKSIQSELNVLKKENMKAVQANTSFQEHLRTLKQEKESLQNKLDKEKERHNLEIQKSEDLASKVASLLTEKVNLQAEIAFTTDQMTGIETKNKQLMAELEICKRKQLIKVQLYYQRRGELIVTVEEELTRILRQTIQSTGKFEIEFVRCMHISDVTPDLPLLLLCISASRIGTDAANTIQGLRLTPKMSLLIFHHKDMHALPSQASYQVLTGGEYKALSGIFDLGFLTGKGIYSCPLNDNSIAKIINFIKTESVQGCYEGLSR